MSQRSGEDYPETDWTLHLTATMQERSLPSNTRVRLETSPFVLEALQTEGISPAILDALTLEPKASEVSREWTVDIILTPQEVDDIQQSLLPVIDALQEVVDLGTNLGQPLDDPDLTCSSQALNDSDADVFKSPAVMLLWDIAFITGQHASTQLPQTKKAALLLKLLEAERACIVQDVAEAFSSDLTDSHFRVLNQLEQSLGRTFMRDWHVADKLMSTAESCLNNTLPTRDATWASLEYSIKTQRSGLRQAKGSSQEDWKGESYFDCEDYDDLRRDFDRIKEKHRTAIGVAIKESMRVRIKGLESQGQASGQVPGARDHQKHSDQTISNPDRQSAHGRTRNKGFSKRELNALKPEPSRVINPAKSRRSSKGKNAKRGARTPSAESNQGASSNTNHATSTANSEAAPTVEASSTTISLPPCSPLNKDLGEDKEWTTVKRDAKPSSQRGRNHRQSAPSGKPQTLRGPVLPRAGKQVRPVTPTVPASERPFVDETGSASISSSTNPPPELSAAEKPSPSVHEPASFDLPAPIDENDQPAATSIDSGARSASTAHDVEGPSDSKSEDPASTFQAGDSAVLAENSTASDLFQVGDSAALAENSTAGDLIADLAKKVDDLHIVPNARPNLVFTLPEDYDDDALVRFRTARDVPIMCVCTHDSESQARSTRGSEPTVDSRQSESDARLAFNHYGDVHIHNVPPGREPQLGPHHQVPSGPRIPYFSPGPPPPFTESSFFGDGHSASQHSGPYGWNPTAYRGWGHGPPPIPVYPQWQGYVPAHPYGQPLIPAPLGYPTYNPPLYPIEPAFGYTDRSYGRPAPPHPGVYSPSQDPAHFYGYTLDSHDGHPTEERHHQE